MTKTKQTVPWWNRFLKQFYLMRTRLIISFLAVLLIPSVLIGYFSYQGLRHNSVSKWAVPYTRICI